jgi:hypothetical protein
LIEYSRLLKINNTYNCKESFAYLYLYATDNRDHLLLPDAYVSVHWLSRILCKMSADFGGTVSSKRWSSLAQLDDLPKENIWAFVENVCMYCWSVF